jgi:hypothetical protein
MRCAPQKFKQPSVPSFAVLLNMLCDAIARIPRQHYQIRDLVGAWHYQAIQHHVYFGQTVM